MCGLARVVKSAWAGAAEGCSGPLFTTLAKPHTLSTQTPVFAGMMQRGSKKRNPVIKRDIVRVTVHDLGLGLLCMF